MTQCRSAGTDRLSVQAPLERDKRNGGNPNSDPCMHVSEVFHLHKKFGRPWPAFPQAQEGIQVILNAPSNWVG